MSAISAIDTESHPAFYHSKKRIWDFPITAPTATGGTASPSWRSKLSIYCVGGFDSLWKLWYTIFAVVSTCWLAWLAVLRHQEFKQQAFHPRFGVNWNWVFPLNLQVSCLVLLASLIFPLIYSAVSRVGHAANDGISLGRDCLHLHAMLAHLPILKVVHRSAVAGDQEATERLRSRIAARSIQSLANEQPDFESFIIREGGGGVEAVEGAVVAGSGCFGATKRQLRPFSSLIHVIIAFVLLLPVAMLEAEQIKNDAIPPEYVWHTNLDWILNGFHNAPNNFIGNATNAASVGAKFLPPQQIQPASETLESYKSRESHSRFPSHPFPSVPTDISPEFVLLAASLLVLTIRFAVPFWFTSRPFSALLSTYIAVSGCYVLIEAASLELLIKLFTAGYRDTNGVRIDVILTTSKLLSTPIYVIVSVVGFFALIAGIMAFYAFGELLFQEAVTNYAKLIMAGEFDASRNTDPSTPDERGGEGSTALFEQIQPEGNDFYGPSVIAITTKAWRPTRRGTQSQMPRTITPSSALSASCDTLRSKGNSALVAPPNLVGKTKKFQARITFWPCIVSGISFLSLVISRSCLITPMLQCYWYTGIKLPLVFVIFSICYLILWLVLWFGVTVKTAWRFRLLHLPAPTQLSPSCVNSPKNRLHADRLGLGAAQFAPWPLMNNPAAAAAAQFGGSAGYFWPWLHYQNSFVPQQNGGGSLAFGGSPTPYDNGYMERGAASGMVDSVYGCLPPDGGRQQQANCGGLLRVGPPTLSDESDNAMPHLDYDPNASYAYLQKRAGLVSIGDVDRVSEASSPQQQQFRGGAGSLGETAYVSLASLGRAGSPQRSQGGSRRGVMGTRVTFNDDVVNGDVNNGSSDSGVCTNGSGSRVVGKLNLSSHPLFMGSGSDRSKSPQGFGVPTASSPVRLENDARLCSQV